MNKKNVRFEFGENWSNYSELITNEKISASRKRLNHFLQPQEIKGKSFLDIGCGSGIHSVAALLSEADPVVAIDYDIKSVETAQQVIKSNWQNKNYSVFQGDILDSKLCLCKQLSNKKFDIVYSWGVLHHTGNLPMALKKASAFTDANGYFLFSVYGWTKFCWIWKKMKKWYCSTSKSKKQNAEKFYTLLFGFYLLLRFKSLKNHIKNYSQNKRGMDFYHDLRDWLGGHPYESISKRNVLSLVEPLGFKLIDCNVRKRSGLFGSGCDEYLFKKI